MAMTYQNFASLGVNLNRQKYGPLDISSVFTTEADLKYYLSKGTYTEGVSTYWYKNANEKIVPYPYEGQVIATAINDDVKVYVLRLDAEGNFEAKAIEPEVDGKTVKLTNGKLIKKKEFSCEGCPSAGACSGGCAETVKEGK